MADQNSDTDHPAAVVIASDPPEEATESVASPAKVLRIGSMTKELLEEVRRAPLDDAGRGRLREIYETSVRELADGLSGDLKAEPPRRSLTWHAASAPKVRETPTAKGASTTANTTVTGTRKSPLEFSTTASRIAVT